MIKQYKSLIVKFWVFVVAFVLYSNTVAYGEETPATQNPGYEYYYTCLNSIEKEIYSFLISVPKETATYRINLASDIKGLTDDELNLMLDRAATALHDDHPEIADWYNTQGRVSLLFAGENYLEVSIEASPFFILTDQQKADHIIDVIVNGADPSWNLFTKARYVHRTIIAGLNYNLAVEFENDELNTYVGFCQQNIYSINTGLAVCEGYCKVFKTIADRIRLPCIIISSRSHAFLYVMNDNGNWYGVDPQDIDLIWYGSSELLGNTFNPDGTDIYEPFGVFSEQLPLLSTDSYMATTEDNNVAIQLVDINRARDDIESELYYDYRINDDAETCTLIRYTGPEKGDLIVPEVIDGYTVTIIGNSAYAQCRGFDGSLIIPDTVTIIEHDAFRYCNGLTGELKLSSNLQVIEDSAFYYCTFKGPISFPDSLIWIGNRAFTLCLNVEGNIILPDHLTYLGDKMVFSQMGHATGCFYIPSHLESFSASSIYECGFSEIEVAPDNPSYCVYDGVLYSKDMKRLVFCPRIRQGALYVPEGVEIIGENALAYCRSITELILPDSVQEIGQYGCRELTGLSSPLELPMNLIKVGYEAFSNTPLEDTIHIGANMVLDSRAFYSVINTTVAYIEEGITSLPECCFAYNSITEFHLPASLLSIDSSCFWSAFKSIVVYAPVGSYAESFANENHYIVKDSNRTFHLNVSFMELCANSDLWPSSGQLQAISEENGDVITDVVWSAPFDAPFTVLPDGTVTAHPGMADNVYYSTVTATNPEGHSESCVVCCIPDPAEVRILLPVRADVYNARELILNPGQTCDVRLSCYETGLFNYFSRFIWSIEDTGVADVGLLNSSGGAVIRALSTGTTYLTMTGCHGEHDVIRIIVANEPNYMYFENNDITLYYSSKQRDTIKLQPVFLPEGSNAGITEIYSNNYDVVRAFSDGTIEAVGIGKAIVTVKTSNDLFTDVAVNVVELSDNIISGNINQKSVIYVLDVSGEILESKVQLGAQYVDTGTEIVFTSWRSLDPTVAAVTEAGLVSSVSIGSTTVQGTTDDGTIVLWDIICKSKPAVLKLPSELKTVDEEAFLGLACEIVLIPDSCTAVGKKAFANCKDLFYVYISPSVVSIAPDAFEGCGQVIFNR